MNNLIDLMQKELDLYTELSAVLQIEQEVLVAQDISKIESVANQKLAILDKIKLATESRLAYLKDRLNIEVNSAFSFANWLLQHDNNALKLWLNLETMVINTKATNDINAELVNAYLSETNQALEILKDASPSLTQSYDKKGSSNYSNFLRNKYKA